MFPKSIDRQQLIRTQAELSELIGCPGREETVADYIIKHLESSADRVWRDGLGNVLAVKDGVDHDGQQILLDAHMDEVGFIVSHIEEQGFLRIDSLGNIDKRLLLGTTVQFPVDQGSVIGVIGSTPPHATTEAERSRVPEIRDMFVDIGARSTADVLAGGIDVGSTGGFLTDFRQLDENTLLGKAFDNRSACTVLLHVAEALTRAKGPHSVLFSFSVQEETGGPGSRVAAWSLEPSLALVVENTTATDVPDTPDHKVITRLGAGPAVTVADRSAIVPRSVLERIKAAAEADEIAWQYKKPTYGGTNAGAIAFTGVPTGVVSVPCRYIHGPAAMLRVQDLMDTIRLVTNFCLI